MTEFTLETLWLDLPAVCAAFARRLHDAGLHVATDRAAAFASALALVRPVSRRRLYWTARAVFVCDPVQVRVFDAVFAEVFGRTPRAAADPALGAPTASAPASGGDEPGESEARPGVPVASGSAGASGDAEAIEIPFALAASDEEVLREKSFDALSAEELRALYGLIERLELATPVRRTRRERRGPRGPRVDMRRTLRTSLRSAGEPVRLWRRRRRVVPRRLVLLCDISGSMEPYARAYLQFLTSAAASGTRVEAFLFATRLTRVTRALAARNPTRAMAAAAAAAPDWSSGTRLGAALREFNHRHGRRGMARGAVVVVISDGWERGDPALVAREMERLSRLAHRIVWVNPRVAAADFAPRAGGMAAALPFCDALVSGHSVAALEAVVDAIAGRAGAVPEPPARAEEPEPWPSATPVPGSSVAMPSGYGPSRGRTTPGWSVA